MAEDSASASGQSAARRPIFRELDPDEGDELETTEIESLWRKCEKVYVSSNKYDWWHR